MKRTILVIIILLVIVIMVVLAHIGVPVYGDFSTITNLNGSITTIDWENNTITVTGGLVPYNAKPFIP